MSTPSFANRLGKWFSAFTTHSGIAFMRLLALLPLPLVRGLGTLLGWALYALVGARRRVVKTNLMLCFKELPSHIIRRLTVQTFVYFAQAWLDRSWLWHAPRRVVERRVSLVGAVQELQGSEPTVIFLPHFVGLDAAWVGVTLRVPRPSTTIYTDQSNKLVDAWILRGRRRFGNLQLFGRIDGVKPIVSAIRSGQPLYLLPDMDFGPDESVFVPFFGVPTATVPSLPRFARLGHAKVVPVLSRLTPTGYEVSVLPAWADYPSQDPVLDTARMNAYLEAYIRDQPAQYYWVHKRFKTRPPGSAELY
ncbi:MAG: lipid A biosynthesis acyltransferase [Chitinophagaceae bacterium]|nr:lipid A biosynthesis acyltransferase [Polaromonas sp.]